MNPETISHTPITLEERLEKVIGAIPKDYENRQDLLSAINYVIRLYERGAEVTTAGEVTVTKPLIQFAKTHDYSESILRQLKGKNIYRSRRPEVERLCLWLGRNYGHIDLTLARDIRNLVAAINSQLSSAGPMP